jgi:TGF-beta receptor
MYYSINAFVKSLNFYISEFERCKKHNKHNPSVCFSFKIPQDVDVSSIESAHLWIYKKHNHDMNFNHTFEISEVSHWGDDKDHVKRNPLAIQQTNFDEGWVKIDLNWSVRNWLQYEELTHVVQIACKTCGPKHVPIGLKNDRKPFIVIDTLPQKNLNRGRRSSVNCSPQTKTCCRESQYISFADIGWDDWIIFPPGYDAYFCRGTCSTAGSITRDGSYHSTIMRVSYSI